MPDTHHNTPSPLPNVLPSAALAPSPARPTPEMRTSGAGRRSSSADEATLNGDNEARALDGTGGLTEEKAYDLEKNMPGEDTPRTEPKLLVRRGRGDGRALEWPESWANRGRDRRLS